MVDEMMRGETSTRGMGGSPDSVPRVDRAAARHIVIILISHGDG